MLHYHRTGAGRPLVLQHGFLGGGGYFAPQMAALGHAFDVIAPDLPGFAGSRDVPAVDTVEALSKAQVSLLDALGIGRFSLLGHSMGGMVALQTALDHPDRVERLVLYATNSSGNLPGRFETFAQTADRVRREGVARVARFVTATWFDEREDAPLYRFCLDAGHGAHPDAVLGALRAFESWTVDDRLRELQMPILVICGDRDRSYSLDGLVRLAKALPHADLCVLPGGSHCVHLEQTAAFDAAVLTFLTAQGAGRR